MLNAKKTTILVVVSVFIIVGAIIALLLLTGKDQTSLITPIFVTALGIALLLEVSIIKAMSEFKNKKFTMNDVFFGLQLFFGGATAAVGISLFFGITIPVLSTVAGIVVAITTLLLIPQLFIR